MELLRPIALIFYALLGFGLGRIISNTVGENPITTFLNVCSNLTGLAGIGWFVVVLVNLSWGWLFA